MNSTRSKNVLSTFLNKLTRAGRAILFSILLACCGTQTTTTVPAALPTATIEPKVALRESIIQVLGTDGGKIPRLTKIVYSYPEAGDITITWAISDNTPQHSTKENAQIDATNILKVLSKEKTRFIYVVLIGTFPTQDKYGSVAETQVMNLGFNKSKLDRIRWEDFQPSDIYDLADVADIADEWK